MKIQSRLVPILLVLIFITLTINHTTEHCNLCCNLVVFSMPVLFTFSIFFLSVYFHLYIKYLTHNTDVLYLAKSFRSPPF